MVVALGLFLIFPKKGLEDQLARAAAADPLTVEYLKVFLAARPDSPRLRMTLARQLVQMGRFDDARAALGPLTATEQSALRIEAQVYEFEILEKIAYALPPGSAGREHALGQARARLPVLGGLPLDLSQMAFLAQRAVAMGDAGTAVRLYARLAARGELRTEEANADAARLVLGLGDYGVAAQLYFRAQERAPALARKREYYMEGVRTLMAGNLYDEAIREADRKLGPLDGDIDTLKFLARTAQAANRPDAAQRYAKMLLRMALLRQLDRHFAQAGPLPFGAPPLERTPPAWLETAHVVRTGGSAGGAPATPFDDEIYTLGFNIFIGAGNLDDGFRVAESAVAQAPDLPEWRRRLAQVAEWRGVPRVALVQWLAHARLTGDAASWDAAQRLAEGLFDDAALLVVLNHRLDRDPRRFDIVTRIVALHEREGRPEAAIAFLTERARGAGRRPLLETLAQLAARAGRDQLEFDTYAILQNEFGPSTGYATRIATRHYLTGDLRSALAALEEVAAQAAADDVPYWQMTAELARLLQFDDQALAAYQRLLSAGKYSEADLQNVIALLDAMRPDQAARVAEFAFAKYRRADLALQVLYQHGRGGNTAAIGHFLAGLPSATLADLLRDARFLSARAAHLQRAGDLRAALADLKAAHALAPGNADTQAAILWAMIGLRDTAGLKAALVALAPAARGEARLWGPFAAALMSLNRQADALVWFRRQVAQKDDYLWLMAYAECLDANSLQDAAWQIRRRVWTGLRKPSVLATIPADQLLAMRDRLAALSQTFAAGDRAQALLQGLLRADLTELVKPPAAVAVPATGAELVAALQAGTLAALPVAARAAPGEGRALPEAWFVRDAAPPPRHPASDNAATVRELALGWALNHEADELARAWLTTRYADHLARPLWGELSVALAGADLDTLTRLLDDLPDWLPMLDRVEAALRIGRPALARTLAFEQLDHLQFDEALHLRFTDMVVEDPARLAGAVAGIRQSPLSISQRRTEASADLTPRLKLGLTLSENRQSTQDETALVNVPATDNTVGVFARYRTPRGPVTLTLHHRTAMREINGMKLDYDLAVAPRLRLAGSAGLHLTATELALLRLGGIKDSFDNTLTYAISKRDYLRFGLALNRYRTQDHTALGRGTAYSVEAGHRIRVEYPDFNLRVFNARHNFSASGQSDALITSLIPAALQTGDNTFLPQSYTQWGAAFGWGQSLQERHTRAWRPFFDVTLFRNSLTGPGRGVRLGAAGSVLGQDHAAFYFGQSTGTPGSPQGFREFGLTYQWFY